MTSNFNFTITHAFPGSDKQKEVGIYATFNMTLNIDGETVIALSDLKLSRAKDGKFYIGSPYRSYNKDGEDKKIHYIRIWPDKHNWAKQEDIVNAVMSKINEGNGTNAPAAPSRTTTRPATSPNQKSPKVSTEAW